MTELAARTPAIVFLLGLTGGALRIDRDPPIGQTLVAGSSSGAQRRRRHIAAACIRCRGSISDGFCANGTLVLKI
jgi:hypothetical protein